MEISVRLLRLPRVKPKTRRRVDAALLVVGGILAGVAAVVGAMQGDSERVAAFWAGAAVRADGGARIVEVIDYDYGSESRHGIFRDVPGLPSSTPVVVESPSAPDNVARLGNSERESRIQIGDPNRTVTGRHRYTIEYPLLTLTRDRPRVAWNAVGAAWPVPIRDVEIHLVAPYRLEEARCFRGTTGSRQSCSVRQPEPGHLVAHVGSLGTGQGVTIEAVAGGVIDPPALPALPSGRADDPGSGVVPAAVVAVIAALATALPTSRIIRRTGRERVAAGGAATAAWGDGGDSQFVLVDSDDLESLATVEFAPPAELSPAQGGVLLHEGVAPDQKTAWLVQAAIDGYVRIEENGSDVMLVRGSRADGPAGAIIDKAFAGRHLVLLGKYDESFAEAWSALEKELSNWQRSCGLWDPAGHRREIIVRVVGAAVGVVGFVGTGFAAAAANVYGPGWLAAVAVAAAVAGIGWAGFLRAWELRVRSVRGSGLWLRVESFRRFLAASEARHADEAAKRGVLREYTAWAVAVGEVNRWSRAVQSAGVAVADHDALRYAVLAPSLTSATSQTSVAPSSSSSGGGGGGVGSGGGGGGGGSW